MRRNAWRSVATLMVGALLTLIPVLAPSVAAPAGAYPATVCATLQVSTTTPQVGEALTVTGVNFLPGAKVTLKLKPAAGNTVADSTVYTLKTVTSNASGAFTTTVTMPDATTGRSNFILFASSGAPAGSTSCPADPATNLSLAAAGASDNNTPDTNSSGAPGSTAFTGVNVLILVLIAAALITVGAVITRRGKATSTIR